MLDDLIQENCHLQKDLQEIFLIFEAWMQGGELELELLEKLTLAPII